MNKKIIFLLFFFIFLLIPCIAKGTVVINEIMYDLETGLDAGREWVEILNYSDTSVDLTGWKFYEANTNHGLIVVQGNITLPPNGYAIIADKPDKFLLDNPSYSGTLFDSTFSLNNSGENLALKNKDLIIIDEVNYSSSWGANGNGRSLQRKNPSGSSNDPINWGSGVPTPGLTNSISPEEPEESTPISEEPTTEPTATTSNQPPIADAGDNIISFIDEEITFDGSKSYDPDGLDLAYEWNLGEGGVKNDVIVKYKYSYPGTYLVTLTIFDGRYYISDTITVEIYPKKITINEFLPSPTGKDEEEEWIELYNDSEQIININGWQLDDEDEGSKPFIFPKNTLIAPQSYLVFSRKTTGIALNNDKDKVRLLLSTGVVFQEINYGKAPEGKSSARTPEGFVWSMPTPGLPNVIGAQNKEISYNKSLQSETTKSPSENIALYNKEDLKNSINGGWADLPQQTQENKNQNYYNLANIGETNKGINYKLVLIITIIIVIAFIISFGIIKIKKGK